MNLITVFRTFNDAEAHVIRSRLETAGFNPRVEHELVGSSAGGFSITTGGILVQVPEEEGEPARALLDAPEPASSDDEPTTA
jgi:hypothetical protein